MTDKAAIKILILAANPTSTASLRLGKEVSEIEQILQRTGQGHRFKVIPKFAIDDRELRHQLLTENPQVVHFCGHGEGEAGLILEHDSGRAQWVSTDALAGLFKQFTQQIKCVVLNACYSEVQAEAIAQHIPYVIGMKQPIGDSAARKFSEGLYDALGNGRSIEQSFGVGCNAIDLANSTGQAAGARKLKVDLNDHQGIPSGGLIPVLWRRGALWQSGVDGQEEFLIVAEESAENAKAAGELPAKYDFRRSQGAIINPSGGTITQNFGNKTVSTGGGDYAEGDIYKQTDRSSSQSASLESVYEQVKELIQQFHQQGQEHQAEDLQTVEVLLKAALGGDEKRRSDKLKQAKQMLEQQVESYPEWHRLLTTLQQVR